MIPTLVTDCYLYKVNRHRQQWLTEIEKRRALIFVCVISAVITFGVVMFIIQK
jgi:hypothetical protein